MWVDIPKNASKSVSHYLMKVCKDPWIPGNFIQDSIYDYHAICVVRDVLDRWRGSTLEVCHYPINHGKLTYSEFGDWFDKQNWKNFDTKGDLHHKPISFFTDGLSRIQYVALDRHFESSIQNAFNTTESLPKINATKNNEIKKMIEPYVDFLLEDIEFVNKIYKYYAEDQLIFEEASALNK